MIDQRTEGEVFAANAGIAIGPILFIIAILAILAAAIAAGSGSFTSGTSGESNRTKSSALIQIGENMKIGMDRITMEGGLDPTSVVLNVQLTNATSDLFSPTGGGIAPPSVGMANNPSLDKWYFAQGVITGLGTGGSNNDVVAFLPVSAGVCSEVNNRAISQAITPSAALGATLVNADPTAGTFSGTWPLPGVSTGCIQDTDVTASATASPTTNYFFYQVLAIQ